MIPLAAVVLLGWQAAGAVPAASVRIEAPARVAEVDLGQLKGQPARLAWSRDGAQIYLQTVETKRDGTRVPRHYVVPASGGRIAAADSEPEWASAYWAWKSAQAAPGAPAFKIGVDTQRRVLRSTANPRGGGLAGMGGDPGAGSGGTGRIGGGEPVAVGEAQNATVYRMLLHGDVIGEWINAPIVPGETFGWAPRELGIIAYSNLDGALVIADAGGAKQEIKDTSHASFPAWSEDGSKLAFLRKRGGKKLDLVVASVRTGGQ